MLEIPPSFQDEPEPASSEKLLSLYASLEAYLPRISFVKSWGKWIYLGDKSPEQFPDFQSYFDEFPYIISVDQKNNYVSVTDPGSGNGSMIWEFRFFELSSNEFLAVVTETDTKPDQTDSKIWIGRGNSEQWTETPSALEWIHRHEFFGSESAQRILEEYELISLIFSSNPSSDAAISVHSRGNFNFECANDQPFCADEIPDADHSAICNAWKYYQDKSLNFDFDSSSASFRRK